jgi:hypothetical protein
MIKPLVKYAATILVASAASYNVSAVPLTGVISMSTTSGSSWTGDGGNVNSIASILNFGLSDVDFATGSFAPALGSTVTWGQPLTFATPAVNNPLWTVTAGPITYTFEVDAVPLTVSRTDLAFPLPDTLDLSGMGVLKATGFTDTRGGWNWTGTMSGTATFSFASTTIPTVPDSGATAALLGLAMGALAFLRRRLA